MKIIENLTFPEERALYASRDVLLKNCLFDGEEDGESALKESSGVTAENCYFNLRYPFWHVRGATLSDCVMTELCRAALWYSGPVDISDSKLHGIKALRECEDVVIRGSDVVSPEFGWRCRGLDLCDSSFEGDYAFLSSSGIRAENIKLKGKYSFQYSENVTVENSVFDTKDAFWHAKNVTVRDSVVRGEYLAWYSENVTFVRCRIIGTQALCYCRGLKLIDCETEDTDLSFEYSDVDATVRGEILSVKNPRSGKIEADRFGQIVLTPDSVYPCECALIEREKRQ